MKIKNATVGAVELLTRFEQDRADHFKAKADALEARMEKIYRRVIELRSKAHKHSEKAAGLRGLTSIARERNCSMMTETAEGHMEFFNKPSLQEVH